MSKWQRARFQPGIPLGEQGSRVTACDKHRRLSREAAKEGMVLLKNQGDVLPLKKGMRIALFGKGTIDYVKGGGGSGDVTVSYSKNLYQGFSGLDGAVEIEQKLVDFYQENVKRQYIEGAVCGMTVEPEVPEELYRSARAFTDTAIISICRFSGEGWDRKSKYDKGELAADPLLNRAETVFEEGDFYLTHQEKKLVEKVKEYFPKIVVALNVGGMVDTEWFAHDEKINSVLMTWQGGMEGGTAAAELLCGLGNPCGKLADTFAKRLEDYPSSANFHESEAYVDYSEDIYVGYRYFETIPDADKKVNYPFGYGLSYTEFSWKVENVVIQEEDYWIQLEVTNIGSRPGKEVLQLYIEAPQGKLGKARRVLAAFAKTRLLQTGESQRIILSGSIAGIASYDDLGKIKRSAYILEKGEYFFHIGNSVRDTECLEVSCYLEQDKVIRQLETRLAPTSLKERMLADGSFEVLPQSVPNDPDVSMAPQAAPETLDGLTPAVRYQEGVHLWQSAYKQGVHIFEEVADGKITLEEFVAQLDIEELAHLLGGQPNTGVANTFGIGNMSEYGIPNVMTADGPAGLRIEPKCGVCTTAWPCATLLASTWNEELVYQVGEAGAKEVKENNISVWLTPAVNIHRSPLCGRNFEYYSEDPYLTGKLASAMVKGIQSQHIAATVKHFAFNNKETNRKKSDSRVSERAAREIYLKAFEIIVTEADPWCIMSSYNIVNGRRTSESRELLVDILRGEWDYQGMVTTDWWTFGEHYREVKAQNDLKMACGFPETLEKAVDAGALKREEMEICAKHILEMLLKLD